MLQLALAPGALTERIAWFAANIRSVFLPTGWAMCQITVNGSLKDAPIRSKSGCTITFASQPNTTANISVVLSLTTLAIRANDDDRPDQAILLRAMLTALGEHAHPKR